MTIPDGYELAPGKQPRVPGYSTADDNQDPDPMPYPFRSNRTYHSYDCTCPRCRHLVAKIVIGGAGLAALVILMILRYT